MCLAPISLYPKPSALGCGLNPQCIELQTIEINIVRATTNETELI